MAYLDKVALAKYSRAEDWINSISHMIGVPFTLIATILCLVKAFKLRSWQYAVLAVVYGITMLAMYSCSSVYHALRPNKGKKVMRMIDHSMIFPMIAGTITPYAILIIVPHNPILGWAVFAVAWVSVIVGISFTMTMFAKTQWLQLTLYLAVGWVVIVAFKVLFTYLDRTGFILLLAGGISYTVGAIVYGIGSKKKYFHSAFHIFVLIGSILHFLSLYMYVFI
ncbi:MAG: hemolysin III family protein [Oscillospiraceae bacterium]